MNEEPTKESSWSRPAGLVVLAVMLGCGDGTNQGTDPVVGRVAQTVDCATDSALIEQIECYVERATLVGHPRPCQEAGHEGVRYQCYAILAGRLKDASLCDDIPRSSDETRALRDSCLSDVAEVLQESTLCMRIDRPGLRDSCYFKVAALTGDTTLCDSIDDPGLNSGCTGEPVLVDPPRTSP